MVVEAGMILNEEGEKERVGAGVGGGCHQAFFSPLHRGPSWLSHGELCPLACHKLAELFTLIYAH